MEMPLLSLKTFMVEGKCMAIGFYQLGNDKSR
jgi:hypothetical protein